MPDEVVEVKEWTASASQISTWKMCHRKWFYDKIMKLPRKQSVGAEVGTGVHAVLEKYVATGERGEPHSIAGVAIHDLLRYVWDHPTLVPLIRNPNAKQEEEIHTTLGGTPIMGYIDLHWRDGSTMYILDYKTTKDFKYAKSEEAALFDPQTIVYGKWALEQEGIDRVVFNYFTIRTASPAVQPRPTIIEHTWETIAEYVAAADAIVLEMKEARTKPEFRIRQNRDSCFAFGKCEFADVCRKTATVQDYSPPTSEETHMIEEFDALLNDHSGAVAASGKPAISTSIPPKPLPAVAPPKKAAPAAPATVPAPAPRPTAVSYAKPVIYFTGQPMNEEFELFEDFLDRTGFMKRYSDANKGQHYLTSAYNAGERIIAVDFCTAVFEGKVQLPAHLVVADNSKIGYFVRLESRYLTERATLVGRSGI